MEGEGGAPVQLCLTQLVPIQQSVGGGHHLLGTDHGGRIIRDQSFKRLCCGGWWFILGDHNFLKPLLGGCYFLGGGHYFYRPKNAKITYK